MPLEILAETIFLITSKNYRIQRSSDFTRSESLQKPFLIPFWMKNCTTPWFFPHLQKCG